MGLTVMCRLCVCECVCLPPLVACVAREKATSSLKSAWHRSVPSLSLWSPDSSCISSWAAGRVSKCQATFPMPFYNPLLGCSVEACIKYEGFSSSHRLFCNHTPELPIYYRIIKLRITNNNDFLYLDFLITFISDAMNLFTWILSLKSW